MDGMFVAKLRAAAFMFATALLLTACGGGAESDNHKPATEFDMAPSGDALSIDPLDAIPGAALYVSDGVSIDVPPGFDVDRFESGNDLAQIVIKEPTEERAAAIIMVIPDQSVSNEDVDASSLAMQRMLGTGGFTDTVRIPVIWDSWPYGTGVKGTLEFPDVAEGGTRDFLYVLLRDEAGTKFISVSTEAAVDELDGSIGMKILRTLRPVQ